MEVENIKNEDLVSFENILDMSGLSQVEFSNRTGISTQMICDVKMGRKNLGIVNLANCVREFPTLPWIEYIKGIEK